MFHRSRRVPAIAACILFIMLLGATAVSADLDIIEVQMGDSLVEDDIVRLCLSWEEIMERVNRDQLEGGA